MYAKIIKPVFDRILAFIGFLCLLFIFIPVTVALLIANNGSAFFIQKRPGKNSKLFNIIKFKTMNDKRDNNGQLLPDEVRLTRVGRTVRKLSLDEIPQLINVLKGDMSLIGPRPLLPEYLPLYSKKQARRHEVKPGITGWAQVNGRNAISWQEKFDFDVWYVDHVTFGLDCKIAWKTVLNVLKSEGISGGGVETMTKFTGN